MRVEVDLFSGRPNPAWTLDADEAREVGALLAALAPADVRAPREDLLGYRGVLVSGVESWMDGCGDLRVARGAAAADCFGRARTYADPGRALERRLLESARARVPAYLFAIIRAQAGL